MKAESRNYSQYLAQKNNPPPKLHDNTYSMASTCLQGNHVNRAASFSFDPSLLEGEVADTPTSPGLNSRTNPNGSTCNPSSDADQIMDLLTHRQVLKELNHFRLLYKAALRGDWGAANLFLQRNPDAVAAKINVSWMTALSVAASAGHAQFVQKLVEKMSVKQLESKDRLGRTALFYAAMADCTQSAKAMVTKNPNLTQIRNDENATPLLCALTYGSTKMVRYLYSVTRDADPSPFRGGNGVRLLVFMIASGFYDTALDLVQRYPQLATARDDKSGYTALLALSQRPSAFPSRSRYGFLERLIYSLISVEQSGSPRQTINGDVENPPESGTLTQVPDRLCSLLNAQINKVPMVKQVRDMKLTQIQSVKLVNRICEQLSSMETDEMLECFLNPAVLNIAAEHGNTEVVIQCCEYFPDLLWLTMKGRSIFHVAVEHRQDKIFSLVYGMSARRRLLTSLRVDDSNTMLHMVAKLAPSPQLNVASGAALQMQRELQWFKGVEKIVDPSFQNLRNSEGKTPRALFSEHHKELAVKGEKWMKETATPCMIVATIIASVVFGAAFTVPGGINGDSGIPIFLQSNYFMAFVVSDAMALFFSTTSIVIFLSILTSSYNEEDFLIALPRKLIIGLGALFISVAAMVTAFSAGLYIVLGHRVKWVIFPITLLACLPLSSFALLQFPLFVEIIHSTYGSPIFQQNGEPKV